MQDKENKKLIHEIKKKKTKKKLVQDPEEKKELWERGRELGGMIVAMSRCWRWLQRFVYFEYLLFHIRIRGLMGKTNLVNEDLGDGGT